jgi:hypothetical protein
MKEKRNAYRVFVGKSEGKRQTTKMVLPQVESFGLD